MLRDTRKIKRRRPEMNDYPRPADAEFASPEPSSALAKIVELVGKNKRVLDIGCANGHLARLLRARGCDVTGVDINPTDLAEARDFCSEVYALDLDVVSLPEVLGDSHFDVVIFGDVLGHLRDPARVLDDARHFLDEGAYVVASIPNIAHGAVRLALVKGSFDYADFGILDESQLHFFTTKTITELFLQCGYAIDRIEHTMLPIFSDSDLVPRVVREDYPEALVSEIEADPDAGIHQFVVKAVPVRDDGRLVSITRPLQAVDARVREARATVDERERLVAGLEAQLRQETESSRAMLASTQAKLENTHKEALKAQAAVEEREALLAFTRALLQDTHEEMLAARSAVDEGGRMIAGLEASLAAARSQMQHTHEEMLKAQTVADERERIIADLEERLHRETESGQAALASTQATLQNTHEEMLKVQAAVDERERLLAGLEDRLRRETESGQAALASTQATLQNTHEEMLKAQAAVDERERLLAGLEDRLRRETESGQAALASTQATLQNTHEEMLKAQAAVDEREALLAFT